MTHRGPRGWARRPQTPRRWGSVCPAPAVPQSRLSGAFRASGEPRLGAHTVFAVQGGFELGFLAAPLLRSQWWCDKKHELEAGKSHLCQPAPCSRPSLGVLPGRRVTGALLSEREAPGRQWREKNLVGAKRRAAEFQPARVSHLPGYRDSGAPANDIIQLDRLDLIFVKS